MTGKVRIALVGLGFGGAFLPIYQEHPDVEVAGICDSNQEVAKIFAEKYQVKRIYQNLEEILKDDELDAVHLVTPLDQHEEQTVAVLEAGKHCACTVPMAVTLEGIRNIIKAVRTYGKKYMMMETALYTYHYMYAKELLDAGKLGRIQFLRGSHYQDMTNWPEYWRGLPPMWYGTHAISPLAGLSGARIRSVYGVGSGTMEPWLVENYGNPYPVESVLLSFENGIKGEATRSLFETARAYQEGMFIYGSKASFEWGFRDEDPPYLTILKKEGYLPLNELSDAKRGKEMQVTKLRLPNRYEKLPEKLRKFTVGGKFDPLNPQRSPEEGAGAGHHGSHPHLVHEFVRSIMEDRKPQIDEILGGNITAAGICAHQSAMEGGVVIEVPEF